jgi:methyl-accepting chemotaxis protein
MDLDIDALEASFDLLAPRGDELVETFYARLFAAAPAVRPLFSDDMRRQHAMLLKTLVLVRKSLRDLDSVVPTLRALGARHAGYGAEPAHYGVVAAVLIASMAEVAGNAWLPAYEDAWSEALGVLAAVMLEGAEDEALPAAA